MNFKHATVADITRLWNEGTRYVVVHAAENGLGIAGDLILKSALHPLTKDTRFEIIDLEFHEIDGLPYWLHVYQPRRAA